MGRMTTSPPWRRTTPASGRSATGNASSRPSEFTAASSAPSTAGIGTGAITSDPSGTAYDAFRGFPRAVGGKTGTAQKAIPGGYSDSANIASFLGFLPAENPEIAIVVVVDEPQPLHTGGVVAGPIFAEIASQAVRYLDIPPSTPEGVEGQKVASVQGH